jgi:hypothetical protein
MKLILHIGMGKTGTTALQAALAGHRDILLCHGVLYPAVETSATSHNFLAAFLQSEGIGPLRLMSSRYNNSPRLLMAACERGWHQIKRQVQKHQPDTVVLSAESIFRRLNQTNAADFKSRLLELTDNIHIAAYIRRPSGYYLSSVQECLKASSRFAPPAAFAFREPLEICETLFNRKPRVMAFERERLLHGGIADDFLGRLLPESDPVAVQVSSPVRNESLSAESMAILQEHRASRYPDADDRPTEYSKQLRHLLQKIERNHNFNQRPALMPDVAHYIDHASTDLLWLDKHYAIRFQGIDYDAIRDYPENPYLSCSQVSEICPVDSDRKREIQALVLRQISFSASPGGL